MVSWLAGWPEPGAVARQFSPGGGVKLGHAVFARVGDPHDREGAQGAAVDLQLVGDVGEIQVE